MDRFRNALIDFRPYNEFEYSCSICNDVIVTKHELTESAFKDEVILKYLLQQHIDETGHTEYDGLIDPKRQIEVIDIHTTVNDV